MPNPPILEFDMLTEMEAYMDEMLAEHTKEINALVIIKRQYKKAGKISADEATKKRIDQLRGYKNKAHNFVLFLKDYMKTAYGKEDDKNDK